MIATTKTKDIIENCKKINNISVNTVGDALVLIGAADKCIKKVNDSVEFVTSSDHSNVNIKMTEIMLSSILKLKNIINSFERHYSKNKNSASNVTLHFHKSDPLLLPNSDIELNSVHIQPSNTEEINNNIDKNDIDKNDIDKNDINNNDIDKNDNSLTLKIKLNKKRKFDSEISDNEKTYNIHNIKKFTNIEYYKNDNINAKILIFYFTFIYFDPNSLQKNMHLFCDNMFCNEIINNFLPITCDNRIHQIENMINPHNNFEYFNGASIICPYLCCIDIYYSNLGNVSTYNDLSNQFKLKFPEYCCDEYNDNTIVIIKNMWICINILIKGIQNLSKNTVINFSSVIIGMKIISGGGKIKHARATSKSWWLNVIYDIYDKSLK